MNIYCGGKYRFTDRVKNNDRKQTEGHIIDRVDKEKDSDKGRGEKLTELAIER